MTIHSASGPTRTKRLAAFLRAEGEALTDQRELESDLLKTQVSYSALRSQFVLILTLSSFIATLGLMADSTVAIVGAMLIAPLMKPILACAYGLVINDRRLQLRSSVTLVVGVVVTMVVAGIAERLFGMRGPTVEIMARTRPSLIDLGVAIAAGVAAALASVRRNVADTLPGVAVAVALVPPLCVAGVGFSVGMLAMGLGATLLFAINLVAIILSAVVVYWLDGYGKLREASHGLLILIVVAAGVLTIPLTTQLRQLRADDRAQEIVEAYIHEEYPKNHLVHPNDLSRLDTLWFADHIFVFAEIKAPASELPRDVCHKIQRRLAQGFGKPVNLKIQLLLTDEIKIYPYRLPNGAMPDYGGDDFVPRR